MTEGVERTTVVPRLSPRNRGAHKGEFGRVLVVGGSRGMIGATALAANAALRGGAGLVTVAAPEAVQLAVASLCPCATSLPLSCDPTRELAPQSAEEFAEAAGRADVLAVGPGMGIGRGQRGVVLGAVRQGKPLVLDADGLNNLVAVEGWAALRGCAMVLTPHPGEFARLTGRSIGQVQADREQGAATAARQWARAAAIDAPLVCLLKGAATVVTDGRRVFVNDTGNPGMATGGSGDVLTGLTAAMLTQGLGPFEAACLAANVHGLAGDLAAAELGEVSMIASDLLDFLPGAFRRLT